MTIEQGVILRPAPPRRVQALAFIVEHHNRHGVSPTQYEIGAALGNIGSARVQALIAQLVDRGSIMRTPAKRRNLRVNDGSAGRD